MSGKSGILSGRYPGEYAERPVAVYNDHALYDPTEFAAILYDLMDPKVKSITVGNTLICP